ncbi:hypothetical protein ACLB2K_077348 [Fragaria x ananassa]
MRALLKQQGMWAPLVKKSGDPETAEMASLEEKAHSTILLCLADDIITEVAEELHRRKFPKAIHRTKGTLDYIHSDCWGPSRVDSSGGHRYFVSMIDDYSRMTWVFVMKHKNDVFKNFKQWKALVENQTGKKIKRLRTDNGLKFCSAEFDELCKTEGIARHHTVRNTPQQNGVVERMNQTLLERARCMLSNAGLERRYWAEAVSTACYLINRGPHTASSLPVSSLLPDPVSSLLPDPVSSLLLPDPVSSLLPDPVSSLLLPPPPSFLPFLNSHPIAGNNCCKLLSSSIRKFGIPAWSL